MTFAQSLPRDPLLTAAAAVAIAGAATIAGAWFFEYGLGILPCPLCLEQRWAYYVGIPLAALIAAGAAAGVNRTLLAAGLAVVALMFLANAGLGVYHSGAEWKWWPGPQDCSGPGFTGGSAGNLLQRMQTTRVIRCDEAAWTFLGLSLAGYNALISAGLAVVAAWGVAARRYGSSSVSQ